MDADGPACGRILAPRCPVAGPGSRGRLEVCRSERRREIGGAAGIAVQQQVGVRPLSSVP